MQKRKIIALALMIFVQERACSVNVFLLIYSQLVGKLEETIRPAISGAFFSKKMKKHMIEVSRPLSKKEKSRFLQN